VSFASDDELQSLLAVAEALNFKVDLTPRVANKHPKGQLTSVEYDQVRNILGDYAEFIIPVFWSRTEFVGSVASPGASSLDLARLGHTEFATAALREGQAAPRPSWAKHNYEPFESWAYVRNSVSGCAEQSPGLRRQGFLAVCRKSVSVVSLNVDFQPTLDHVNTWGVTPSQLRDPHWQHVALAGVRPPEYGSITVEKVIAYNEIENVNTFNLARFDGLAAFLQAWNLIQLDGDKHFRKWQQGVNEQLSTFPAPIMEIVKLGIWMNAIPESVLDYFPPLFQDVCESLTYGANVANGTGVDEQGQHCAHLFSSALGVAIESAVDGTKVFVESPFQELDTAVELINANREAVPKEAVSQSAQMSGGGAKRDLAAELEKLASLRQAGILSDEEFTAAKAAVIKSNS